MCPPGLLRSSRLPASRKRKSDGASVPNKPDCEYCASIVGHGQLAKSSSVEFLTWHYGRALWKRHICFVNNRHSRFELDLYLPRCYLATDAIAKSKEDTMFANTTFRFPLFPIVAKSPKRVHTPATTTTVTAQSERMILIDRICDSWGTQYSDLVKYRAL